jgi:RimJ/RimL family protein N-acetyltransferase
MSKFPALTDAVPILETERLVMRSHRVDDLKECAAMWADPEVVHHISGSTFTEDQVWSKCLCYAGLWSLLGFGYWAVEEKASGRFVGDFGFADFKRQIEPPFNGMPENGWVLASWAHGKGFGTEAVRASLDWALGHFEPIKTGCIIAPENVASIRIAEKCGYREIARTTFKGSPTIIYHRALRSLTDSSEADISSALPIF